MFRRPMACKDRLSRRQLNFLFCRVRRHFWERGVFTALLMSMTMQPRQFLVPVPELSGHHSPLPPEMAARPRSCAHFVRPPEQNRHILAGVLNTHSPYRDVKYPVGMTRQWAQKTRSRCPRYSPDIDDASIDADHRLANCSACGSTDWITVSSEWT